MNRKRTLACSRMVLVVIMLLAGSALAQHLQAFEFGGGNGLAPGGGLVVDGEGNFYGTTSRGGLSSVGVVFEISPTRTGGATETVLYNFTGNGSNGDGANPLGDLVFDKAGNLYGVTQSGGPSNAGTVFELSPPASPGGAWTETVLHSFQGSPTDGASPMSGLMLDGTGNLYGTASQGGINAPPCNNGCGVVYELTQAVQGPWTESVLYMFQGYPDGGQPMSPLIMDQAGDLYGTTYIGGFIGPGTVFELTPPAQGGSWIETRLHNFASTDGAFPRAGLTLVQEGVLLGTATGGGANGQGTVFALKPGTVWFTVVHSFDVTDGDVPASKLVLIGSNTLVGTAGGGVHDDGVVFQISYSGGLWTETVLYNFGGGNTGAGPLDVILYKGALYGTTVGGGFNNNGTAFRLSP